jgi:hypothetical protein
MVQERQEDIPPTVDRRDDPTLLIEGDIQVHTHVLRPQTLHEVGVPIELARLI